MRKIKVGYGDGSNVVDGDAHLRGRQVAASARTVWAAATMLATR